MHGRMIGRDSNKRRKNQYALIPETLSIHTCLLRIRFEFQQQKSSKHVKEYFVLFGSHPDMLSIIRSRRNRQLRY